MKTQNDPFVHSSIRILLINDNKELLLMHADDPSTTTPEGTYHGRFWFCIGGQIEPGESILNAAHRELQEETGINPKEVTFGPVVWYGEFDLVLYGKLRRLKQQFIVAHTKSTTLSLAHLTETEKKVIEKLEWFSLDRMRTSNELIYPIGLQDHLEDILNGHYPPEPIWIDLGKKPEAK